MQTTGRYYAAEPGTPHVPGFHHLGSRNWHDRNWDTVVTLGEDMNCPRPWDTSHPPETLPGNFVVGGIGCLAAGELVAHAADMAQLEDGFPKKCYSPIGEVRPEWHKLSSFNRCDTQKFYGQVMQWLYDDDEDSVAEAFHAFIGDDVSVHVYPAVGLLPAICTAIHPTFSVCVIDGTRFFQQFALQAFQSIVRPTNFGAYGTLPLWYNAATYANSKLIEDGMQVGKPIMLVGHSYGACAALNLVARYRIGKPDRTIRYITYGSPKPGDFRLAGLLELADGINLINDTDIAGVIPPDRSTLTPVMLALGVPTLAVWEEWKPPPNQVIQFDEGGLIENEVPILDSIILTAMALKAIGGFPQLAISGHAMGTYLKRIRLRCPDCHWPLDEEVCELLDERDELVVFDGAIIPVDFRIIWGGEPEFKIVPGQPTCEGAAGFGLEIGITYEVKVLLGTQYWFHFTEGLYDSPGAYTLTITTTPTDFVYDTFTEIWQGACDDPLPLLAGFLPNGTHAFAVDFAIPFVNKIIVAIQGGAIEASRVVTFRIDRSF